MVSVVERRGEKRREMEVLSLSLSVARLFFTLSIVNEKEPENRPLSNGKKVTNYLLFG